MTKTYKSAFSGAQMEDTFDRVQNKKITAADVGAVPMLNGGKSVFANSVTGSDTTGDGTAANPYQSFDRAWQDVPMFLNGKNVYIYLAGSFTFGSNRYMCPVGSGLTIARSGDVNAVFTLGAGQGVVFQGANTLTFNRLDFNSSAAKSGSLVVESGDYGFSSCNFAGLDYAVNCNVRARGQIYNCTFTDNNIAISAQYGSSVGAYAATGSGNNTGYLASRGGSIGFTGDGLQAATLYNHGNGGFIKNAAYDVSGGQFLADASIVKDSPAIYFSTSLSNRYGMIRKQGSSTSDNGLSIRDYTNASNSLELALYAAASDAKSKLRLIYGGTAYTVYGAHNITAATTAPTAALADGVQVQVYDA